MQRDRLTARPQVSMIDGPILRSLLSFALPFLLGNLFQQLYNVADTLIVGNFIGKEALAAVSSSGSLILMLVGFLNGMSAGAGVLISKYYGARDYDRLRLAVHTDLAFALAAGLALTAAGVALTPGILRWMGTPETVLPSSIAYFRIYFLGGVALFVYNVCTGILRAVGDSRHPLYFLIFSSCVNVTLDLLFVGVFRWGVGSAAAATVIAEALSALLALGLLLRSRDPWRVELRRVRFHWPSLRLIVRFGLPSGVQTSVISFANVIVQSNINAFGDSAMAGCGAYSKIEGFAFLPVTCFSMALSTFVGQNLGARQYDRVKTGARCGIACSVIAAELIGLTVWLLAPQLIGLFNSDAEVVAFGVRQMHTVSLFYGLLALNHCLASVFQGAGKAVTPMAVMLAVWCVLRVAYITLMVDIFRDIVVVFTAYPVTWSCSAVIFLVYYFKADWLHNFDRLDAAKAAKGD